MNVGSGGGGAAAPAAAAAGGEDAAAAPAEEKKEEGTFQFRHPPHHPSSQARILTRFPALQPRRSLTRTWASVSSTKLSLLNRKNLVFLCNVRKCMALGFFSHVPAGRGVGVMIHYGKNEQESGVGGGGHTRPFSASPGAGLSRFSYRVLNMKTSRTELQGC